ncbi:LacI family DNA-binding transcriptional regulator [Arthrobacter sp. NPDC093128]|uniref:LacI family DNA-binding transcriptional regulator n=1 Tax=Arthrobacter sp. NPDC093128 TaxID=3154979 RepID=UPI003449A6D1
METDETVDGQGPVKPATIYEVARLAGVSHQTVSRHLRGNGGLKAATVAKVQRAIEELNYSPNMAARSLRTRRVYRIVIIVPEATQYVPVRMLNGAAAAAHEAGFLVDVIALEGSAATRSNRLLSLLGSEQLAGVLSFVPLGSMQKHLDAAHSGLPVVVAGEYDDRMRARGTLADGAAAARIVEHLAALGHRKFFHVAGPEQWPSARNRRAAYLEAVEQLGLTSAGEYQGDWSAESGHDAGLNLPVESGVTAVFTGNDQMAIGLMRALHERGFRVPEDISVFGWDDLPESRFLVPSLSTVSMDLEALGRLAMTELVTVVQGKESPKGSAEDEKLPLMDLVIRESTGPARR